MPGSERRVWPAGELTGSINLHQQIAKRRCESIVVFPQARIQVCEVLE
jgi:hypothetical protein